MNESSTTDPSKVLGIISIVLGGVGFLFCPILFGLGGVTCGVLGIVLAKDRPRTLAIIGTILSAVSIPVGMILGYIIGSGMDAGY